MHALWNLARSTLAEHDSGTVTLDNVVKNKRRFENFFVGLMGDNQGGVPFFEGAFFEQVSIRVAETAPRRVYFPCFLG